MKKPEEIAEVTDFVPVGDDSFIDDNGMTNRWAIRRRERLALEEARRQMFAQEAQRALEEQRRQDEENFIE